MSSNLNPYHLTHVLADWTKVQLDHSLDSIDLENNVYLFTVPQPVVVDLKLDFFIFGLLGSLDIDVLQDLNNNKILDEADSVVTQLDKVQGSNEILQYRDPNNPDASINTQLAPGTYFLKIHANPFTVQTSFSYIFLKSSSIVSPDELNPGLFTATGTGENDTLLQQPVYRFYNPVSKGHFFTIDPAERDNVLAHPQWQYTFEGIAFEASSSQVNDDLLPVFRFYNPISRGHFFTANSAEKDKVLANPQWQYIFEGVGFYAYGADSNKALDAYRFYNPVSGGHFFTTSSAERDVIFAHPEWQYSFEGVGFEGGQG